MVRYPLALLEALIPAVLNEFATERFECLLGEIMTSLQGSGKQKVIREHVHVFISQADIMQFSTLMSHL